MTTAVKLSELINGNSSQIVVPSGGIQFADATNANTVANESNLIEQDGYEEGTFTPTLQSGTHSVYSASYIKIGGQVTIYIVIGAISDVTSATTFSIGGMPFTANTGKCVGTSMWAYGSPDGHNVVYMAGGSILRFYQGTTTGGYDAMEHSDLTAAGAEVHLYATYEAS